MGVPGLEPFVCATSKESVVELIQGEVLTREVDYLYADSNGALHSICQRIFNYGEKKMQIDFYEGVSYEKKVNAVYTAFFMSIVNVTKIVRPKKVLYIAIDGSAPLAKQNQQRQRRFGRMRSLSNFDSSSITPGTRFMHDLTIFMRDAILSAMSPRSSNTPKHLVDIAGIWHGIEVIFSPPNVPGEGEHKLMEYLRKLPIKAKTESTHCFFGPDGDLIMLGLSSCLSKVHLLRQDVFRPGYYKYIDIGEGFSKTVGRMFRVKLHSSLQHTKDDFVAAGLFVGNDFLPRIQMFMTVRDGLNFMASVFHQTKTPITRDGSIDIGGLKKFATYVASHEKAMLLDQVTTEDRRRLPPDDPKYLNVLILKNVTVGNPITFDYDTYHDEYNSKHFPLVKVETVCHDYLKTLVWVFEYYRNGIVDWDWAYRHHYPPLMSDFASYIQSIPGNTGIDSFGFVLGAPTFPFEQLLGVLPRASSSLLPEPYASLLSDPNSPLQIYDGKIEYDYQGKIRDHEAVILLPFSDYHLVRKVYHETAVTRKFNRDTPGHPIRFTQTKDGVSMNWIHE